MSTATIGKTKAEVKNGQRLVLKGVHLFYTKNQGFGEVKYGEQEDKEQPHMNRQWATTVLINKEISKKIKTLHKKVGIIEVDGAEAFETKYGVKPPFEADEYYLTNMNKPAFYKDGNEGHKPKFMSKSREDLGEVGIGNGTEANVSFNVTSWENKFGKGTSLNLNAVQVTNLVEYTASADGEDDDFDWDEDDMDEMDSTETSTETEEDGGWE